MERKTGEIIEGRLIPVINKDNKLYDNIDTDMIFHNAHLAITDISQMGQHCFGNLELWQDFGSRPHEGEIIMAGRNFGSGSSRQHAVDCFISLGVNAIIAESYGAIYKRNAINSGMPVLECPGLVSIFEEETGLFMKKPHITLDIKKGIMLINGRQLQIKPMSDVQMNIYKAGNLFEFGKTIA